MSEPIECWRKRLYRLAYQSIDQAGVPYPTFLAWAVASWKEAYAYLDKDEVPVLCSTVATRRRSMQA